MKQDFRQYSKDLVKMHGKVAALNIAEDCLNKSKSVTQMFFYGEAEWSLGNSGTQTMAKTQSKKVVGLKEKREAKTRNFWENVVRQIRSLDKRK